jgi:hypothetical protein
MSSLLTALLIAGLIFPVLSLITLIGSLLTQWMHKKYSSPAFVPFVGPVLLTAWVIFAHESPWLIAVFWIADLGTLAFLAASPRLISEWWQTSSFTKTLTLTGNRDEQDAILTIHSTGHYLLKKSWRRPPGQAGIVGLGEPGRFTQNGNDFELTSHVGLRRLLKRTATNAYAVQEDEIRDANLVNYSLNGWELDAAQ